MHNDPLTTEERHEAYSTVVVMQKKGKEKETVSRKGSFRRKRKRVRKRKDQGTPKMGTSKERRSKDTPMSYQGLRLTLRWQEGELYSLSLL